MVVLPFSMFGPKFDASSTFHFSHDANPVTWWLPSGPAAQALVARLPRRAAGEAALGRTGEDLDDSTNGVGSVQRRERPAHDFDPIHVLRRHRRPVIAGEERRVHARAVHENERLRR